MKSLIKALLGGPATAVVDYFKFKKELSHNRRMHKLETERAIAEAKVTAIREGRKLDHDWELKAWEHSGWKDEYWTIIISIPLVMCFVPTAAPVVLDGFNALSKTPVWYQTVVGIVICAAFGVRWWRRKQA
jgi:hypothetical protein